MRIWTPTCRDKRYWLTLYFRETGQKNFIRVGKEILSFGKGREHAGRLARVQVEITDGEGAIELFPGARILSVVLSDAPGIDERHQASLNPNADEVELVKCSEIVVMPGDFAKDLAGENPQFKKQMEVLNGKRRRFVGK